MSTQRPNKLTTYQPGQPIPATPDFPVKWANPRQARQLWILDRMHFPDPAPPLVASISEAVVAGPFNRAAEQYALPIRLSTLWVNTYLYLSFTPVGAPPDFALKAINLLNRVTPGLVNGLMRQAVAKMTQKYMARLEPVIERLGDYWHNDWLPELKQHLADWENFELTNASMSELLAHLDETLRRIARVWEIHHALVLPSFLALGQFEELYRELLADADRFGAFRLLQGFDNKFLEADRALWRLSRQALTLPKVHGVLTQSTAAEAVGALSVFPEGQIFLAEWRAYLDEYGQRGHQTDGLSSASWLEDPAPALQRLQDYLTQPDRDLEAELKAQAAEREQWVAQVREQLKGYPPAAISRFEKSLKAAQEAAVLHEEHHYWIDQRCQYQARRVILEVGRRLAQAGVVNQPEDAFYLTLAELRETAQTLPQLDRRELIVAHRAEMAHFGAITPPPAIGTMPLMEPPDDPFGRSFSKVFGGLPGARAQKDLKPDNVLRGLAGSPGVARGQARVIRGLAEANKLQKGEILVAEAAMPAWTVLFTTISAVVTDVGGILSHCAVVAREYGIPAVVGTDLATKVIRDGQMVEVDGNTGVVHLLDGAKDLEPDQTKK
jgi:pyruvate,water dikinase